MPQYQNPSLNFVPPKTDRVGPRTQPVAQGAGAEFQAPGLTGVGLVWPPAGGVQGNNARPDAQLSIGVPGMGGYQLLPPGYNEAAVRRAAQVCPGIQRIYEIQGRSGFS
jgi:hypothetical protein